MAEAAIATIGFIGLGVMGEPICANMARRRKAQNRQQGGERIIGFDLSPAPLERLAADGVVAMAGMAELAEQADLIILSLPGGREVGQVCLGDGGLIETARPGTIIVDTSTTPVDLTRSLHETFAARDIVFVDAPVARTRQAAREGKLSIMVGATPEVFERLRPYLETAGSDVTRCGEIGCGQIVKILNNMILFQNVVALAEAIAIGGASGIHEEVLLETIAKGSGDSFALRNHGMKAMLPRVFPEDAFSTEYALKDNSYALALAEAAGIEARGARLARTILEESRDTGNGKAYFPALIRLIEARRNGG